MGNEATVSGRNKIIAKWSLLHVVGALRAHLAALARADKLWDLGSQAKQFLEPLNLSGEDEYIVTMWAWARSAWIAATIRDWYMVNDQTWAAAGLRPDQCCCRRCLAARLGRPLNPRDFTPAPINFRRGLRKPPAERRARTKGDSR